MCYREINKSTEILLNVFFYKTEQIIILFYKIYVTIHTLTCIFLNYFVLF